MTKMFGHYRAKASGSHDELVCYGDGEVEFITSRAAYEATGMTPSYDHLPWHRPLDDQYKGLERHILS